MQRTKNSCDKSRKLLYILYDIRVQLYNIEVTSQDAHWVAVTTWLIHYYYTYTNL